MPIPRTLVIGFDGGCWTQLDPPLQAGWMPNLSRFLNGGIRGSLRSVEPPVTMPAWFCAFTGLSPATLDIWGFTSQTRTPGKFALVNGYRPHEAVWDQLGRRGVKVGVVNFPTMPAPPVHGYFISGMIPNRGADSTYPRSLGERLDREVGGWIRDLSDPGEASLSEVVDLAVRSLEQKATAVELLQAEAPVDFLFVLLSETDRLLHNVYDHLAAPTARQPAAAQRFWKALDTTFGRLHRSFHGDGTTGYTALLSDHGFGPAEGYFFTNRFLQKRGYLVVKPNAPFGWRPWAADLACRVDRALPLRPLFRATRSLSHRLRPRVPGKDGDSLDQTFGWFSQYIDWKATRAYSFPVPEAIYANRFNGPVTPEALTELRNSLKRDLEAFAPGHVEVVDPEALYGRPLSPEAPVLLLNVNGHAWESRGDVNHRVDHLTRRPSFFERQGCHRRDGIIALGGPGVTPGRLAHPVPLMAVAPTLLRLLGQPVPPTMEERPSAPLLEAVGIPPTVS